MNHIYLPIDDVRDFSCYSVYDYHTIRAYYDTPRVNSSSNYIDFYIDNHYLQKTGSQSWSQYATLPVCLSSSSITTEFYYRTDMSDIFIIFFSILFLTLILPFLLIKSLRKRF